MIQLEQLRERVERAEYKVDQNAVAAAILARLLRQRSTAMGK